MSVNLETCLVAHYLNINCYYYGHSSNSDEDGQHQSGYYYNHDQDRCCNVRPLSMLTSGRLTLEIESHQR